MGTTIAVKFVGFSTVVNVFRDTLGDFEVDLEMLLKCCENATMCGKGDQKVKQNNGSST